MLKCMLRVTLTVLCAQLTHNPFVIAKFLLTIPYTVESVKFFGHYQLLATCTLI